MPREMRRGESETGESKARSCRREGRVRRMAGQWPRHIPKPLATLCLCELLKPC